MRKIISALYLFCTVCCISPLAAQVTFIANDATISCEAASFCVEIEVNNFDSITGMQFSYEWDPAIITLNSQMDLLPSGFGLFFPDPVCPGTIGFSWFASVPAPIPYLNLPDGTVIAELCFVPNMTGVSTLDFGPICNSTQEVSGLVNGSSQLLPAVFTPGTIEIQDIENPMLVCPSDTMIISSGTNVYDIAPVSATDNCDLQSVTHSLSGATSGSGSNDASGEFFNEGTTAVTYTATDGAGNTSNCSFDVVLTAPPVSDTILQFIPCVNIDCENGTVSIDLKVTNFDSMTGMQWGMRWDTMMLEYLTVDDNLPPATTYNSGIENGAILFTWFSFGTPTTTLPDSFIIFTLNFNLLSTYTSPGITFEDFSMGIPILVGNIDGNMVQGVDFEFLPETVNVIDNTPPVIVTPCPGNITQSSDAGQCDAVVSWVPPTFTDNCGIDTITNSHDPGDTFPVGNTTVTYTATDIGGNITTCSFTVTIDDQESPIINCPADITAGTDPGLCTNSTLNIGIATATDNCGILNITNNAPAIFPAGITTVVWTASDVNGNTATCSQDIEINDTENPTITCPADITACSSGSVVLGNPITSDNCGVASTTNNAPGSYPNGNTTVTWTVTDLAGNTATCNQIVTIEDMEPPMITCPADVSACTSASVVLGTPTTSDNCGVASVTNNAPGSYPIGLTTVTWTVTDLAGNMATCDQLVTIDSEPPMITCPADVTACTPGPVSIGTPTTNDNCGIASTTNNAPGSYPIGVTTVTWTVTDLAGNMATCDQLVTVDFEPPMITCPPDLTECSSDLVVLGTPVTSDNCGVASVTNNAPGTYPNGTTTVTWTVTDLAGNTATCDQLVTIGDSAPPSITCPTIDAFDADPDMCSVVVNNNLAPVVSDCNPFTVVYTITGATTGSGNNDATGTEFFVGQSLLTYYATDDLGNVDSCSILIQVNDAQNPVINCPSNVNIFVPSGTIDTIVNNIGASASDNCAVDGITYNTTGVLTVSGNGDISGTAFPPGITNITYTVSDVNGNIDSCTFVVNVSIVVNDMIGCPGNQNVANDPDLCSAVVNGIAPTILINPALVDNIQYTLTGATTGTGSDDASGISFNVGTTAVEYILTDNSNNMDTCTFEVVVFDNQNPTWSSCPGNITASATLDGCRAIVNWPIPLPSDNCNLAQIITSHNPNDTFNIGTTAVSYIAIDSAGNIGTCSFIVSVMDNIPPTFTCPADISIGTDAGVCTGTATWNPILVTDNCDLFPTISCDFNSGDAFPVGVTTVTCTATDISGNTATCTFNVIVSDTAPPVVNGCPPDLTISTDQNTCEAIFSWTEPTFTELCSNPVSVSSTHSPGDTFQVGTTTIFYFGVDAAGNSAVCSFDLTVVDNQAPVPFCPAPITVASMVKECGNVVTWPAPIATDDCDNTVAMVPDIPPGSFFPVGVTTVTYTAMDNSGNVAQCSFDVTVADITPPEFTCFDNIVIGIDGTIVSDNSSAVISITPNTSCDSIVIDYLDPPVTDNCNIDSFGVISGLPSGGVFPIGTTTVTFLAIDDSGNSAACVFDIIVLPLPEIMVTINPSDTVCEGQDITLMTDVTTAGATYSWENLNSGWTDTLEQPVITDITLADTGTYSVTVTYPSGCTAVGSAILSVGAACDVVVLSNAPLCSRENLELFADIDTSCNAISFSWIGPGFTSNMQNPVIPDATPANSGTYIVTVEFEGGCSVTESIDVEINLLSAPTINSSCGSDICFGSGCLLSGTQFNPTPDAYFWEAIPSAGAGLPLDTDNNEITVNPTLPGIYIYNYSVEIDGCISDTATIVLMVHGEPNAVIDNFGIDYETTTEIDVVANDTFTTNLGVIISVQSGPTDGTLINNNDGTFSYTPDIGFLGTDQFVYQICYDCEEDLCDNATVTLEVDDDGVCVIPTLITPNMDGVNDELFINCLESGLYPDNELVIVNEWGHQVFRAAPYQNDWFGTYEGKDLPDGTYYYIFKLDNDSEVSKGALTIFR